MKQRYSILFFVAFLMTTVGFAQTANTHSDDLHWYTDIVQAQQVSDSTDRPIFAFFTGSDWCGWCHKLQRDVFQKSEFAEWANSNVILVELDFPRRKQLPPALARQNSELQQVFRVTSFPTIWLFHLEKDAEARKMTINALGSLGYPRATEDKAADTFIDNANSIMARGK